MVSTLKTKAQRCSEATTNTARSTQCRSCSTSSEVKAGETIWSRSLTFSFSCEPASCLGTTSWRDPNWSDGRNEKKSSRAKTSRLKRYAKVCAMNLRSFCVMWEIWGSTKNRLMMSTTACSKNYWRRLIPLRSIISIFVLKYNCVFVFVGIDVFSLLYTRNILKNIKYNLNNNIFKWSKKNATLHQ